MKKHLNNQRVLYIALLPTLVLLLIVTACSSGATTTATTTSVATKTVNALSMQPVSAQVVVKNQIVYVALGASDAVGVGSSEPGAQGYVPLVADRLAKGSHLINLGISGIHLHEAIAQELPLATSTDPQLITIWLVANDFIAGVSYDSYMHDLDVLLKQLRVETHARIVMANLPDLTLLPLFSHASAAQRTNTRNAIQRWNSRISTIAATYNVALVDLFGKNSQLTAHPEYISGDGFHPSPAGYVQLGDYFWQAIINGSETPLDRG